MCRTQLESCLINSNHSLSLSSHIFIFSSNPQLSLHTNPPQLLHKPPLATTQATTSQHKPPILPFSLLFYFYLFIRFPTFFWAESSSFVIVHGFSFEGLKMEFDLGLMFQKKRFLFCVIVVG